MKKLFVLGMAVVMLAAACAAYAYPTFTGPTGLVNAPTAEVAPAGQLDLAVDYFASKNDETGDKNSWPVRVLYGAGSGFEVGAAYDVNGIAGKSLWDVNAKYKTTFCPAGIDLAIGAIYGQANTDPDTLRATQAYLAGTKCFNLVLPIALTIGANWTQLEQLDAVSGWHGFIGADVTLMKQLDLVADYQTINKHLDGKSLWSACLRYCVTPALAVQAGVNNGLFVGTSKSRYFVGANYAFNLAGTK